MSNPALENGLASLGFVRRVTVGLLEDIPEEKLLHQLSPGGNHAVWVIGHLAVTDDVFLTDVAGREAGRANHPSLMPCVRRHFIRG